MTRAWPAGAVTGIGSLPGTDPVEAARLVFGELPLLPHLPELPARGPGAQLIGRGAAVLVDLPVEIAPSGWRLNARAGRDLRRARDLLARDLDALEAAADGYTGAVKLQLAGPWTLAAGLELPNGHRVLADHGAVAELTQSLAEGLREHVAELVRRVPGARPVVQLDEPTLPAVLAGRIPTPSGYGTIRAVPSDTAERTLAVVLDAAPEGARVVHCCASDVPLGLLRAAGVDAISLDAALLGAGAYDALGETIDAGTALWLGVVATDTEPSFAAARDRLHRLWTDLGFPAGRLAADVVATPACGLAGVARQRVRAAFDALRDLSAWLNDGGDLNGGDAVGPDR